MFLIRDVTSRDSIYKVNKHRSHVIIYRTETLVVIYSECFYSNRTVVMPSWCWINTPMSWRWRNKCDYVMRVRPICAIGGQRTGPPCTQWVQGQPDLYCLRGGLVSSLRVLYTCINRVRIRLSIRVRFTFTTGVRIACRYLHWINSNRNIDPNLNLDPSVPVRILALLNECAT